MQRSCPRRTRMQSGQRRKRRQKSELRHYEPPQRRGQTHHPPLSVSTQSEARKSNRRGVRVDEKHRAIPQGSLSRTATGGLHAGPDGGGFKQAFQIMVVILIQAANPPLFLAPPQLAF